MWRAHKEGNALFTARSWAGAMLATQGNAGDVAARKIAREGSVATWKLASRRVVGTLCIGIDANGRTVRPRDRWRLVRRSAYIPFPHGSAMFRREVLGEVGGYSEELQAAKIKDLFFKMAARGCVVTLPDILYHFRYHSENSTLRNGAEGFCIFKGGHDLEVGDVLLTKDFGRLLTRSIRNGSHRA